MDEPTAPAENPLDYVLLNTRLHRRLTLFLQFTLLVGAILHILQGRYLGAATVIGIILLTLFPLLLGRRFRVFIPPEFEVLAVVFIYASLFLGEVQGYYTRFWWWDAVLHTGSGFLLGILGFLLVHAMNEYEQAEVHMKPSFVALFAFMFAMGMGGIWEIFEFGMDQIFGMNMQKSGLIDTMWDLIVDCIGALVISVMGWIYLRTQGKNSFLERWIQSFVDANPGMFGKNEG